MVVRKIVRFESYEFFPPKDPWVNSREILDQWLRKREARSSLRANSEKIKKRWGSMREGEEKISEWADQPSVPRDSKNISYLQLQMVFLIEPSETLVKEHQRSAHHHSHSNNPFVFYNKELDWKSTLQHYALFHLVHNRAHPDGTGRLQLQRKNKLRLPALTPSLLIHFLYCPLSWWCMW